jgi:predicted O-methyltransferase YrrM
VSSTSLELDRDLLNYIQRVTLREPDVLRRLREQTARMPMGRMQVSPEQGQLMGLLIRLMGARRTIEVGVFTGYSSISVALALPPDGRLIACDVSEEWTSVARDYWREAGVDTRIELRLRPALQTLDSLLAEGSAGSFDFAFIDADKENYSGYYERCLKLVRPGGLIAVDNVLWHGDVLDPSKQDEDTRAIRAFNQQLHEDQRVWISLLPVGDGLTLALKK